MKKEVGNRIKKMRINLDITRDDVADQLNISNSAYAKIERGDTDMNVSHLDKIAKFFKVDIADFFPDRKLALPMEDKPNKYGYATKDDIEQLTRVINQLKIEVEKLKTKNIPVKKRRAGK